MNIKHGMRGTQEERIYNSMKQRCCNPKDKRYSDYGGRGIKVCESWKSSFSNFYNDLGPRPGKDYSIDRISNDGDYEPGNVKWSTRKEQQRNMRSNHIVTYEGKQYPLIVLVEKFGLDYSVVRTRLVRGKMSIEDALRNTNYTVNNSGQEKPVYQVSISDNQILKLWPSVKEAAKELNKGNSTIARAARGEYKQAYGFIWKYAP